MPDRVALVTGASGGLGSAIASRLAADGFFVLLHYRSPSRMAESAAEAIRAAGGRCASIAGDFGTSSAIEAFLQQTGNTLAEQALEKFDVLVGNAGVGGFATIETTTEAMFDELCATNVKGTF